MARPEPHPTKEDLMQMNVSELNALIGNIRRNLEWCKSGPVHKSLIKRVQVAEKVRELIKGRESAGDV